MMLLVKCGDAAYAFIVSPIAKKKKWQCGFFEQDLPQAKHGCLLTSLGCLTFIHKNHLYLSQSPEQHNQCPLCQRRRAFQWQRFFCKDWNAFEGLHAKGTVYINLTWSLSVIQISGDLDHRILFLLVSPSCLPKICSLFFVRLSLAFFSPLSLLLSYALDIISSPIQT